MYFPQSFDVSGRFYFSVLATANSYSVLQVWLIGDTVCDVLIAGTMSWIVGDLTSLLLSCYMLITNELHSSLSQEEKVATTVIVFSAGLCASSSRQILSQVRPRVASVSVQDDAYSLETAGMALLSFICYVTLPVSHTPDRYDNPVLIWCPLRTAPYLSARKYLFIDFSPMPLKLIGVC